MSVSSETQPSSVPATATQGGHVPGRWSWTEPAAWTERMLTALDEGVRGGVWYPNAFFAGQGFFSLEATHRLARQPPSG